MKREMWTRTKLKPPSI